MISISDADSANINGYIQQGTNSGNANTNNLANAVQAEFQQFENSPTLQNGSEFVNDLSQLATAENSGSIISSVSNAQLVTSLANVLNSGGVTSDQITGLLSAFNAG